MQLPCNLKISELKTRKSQNSEFISQNSEFISQNSEFISQNSEFISQNSEITCISHKTEL